ncbi:MAG TPA: DUF5916 domain-containing protein [Terriglobia bacterium]|nr:DUF5916 domain-containing protein [Terriglobia bacterium]
MTARWILSATCTAIAFVAFLPLAWAQQAEPVPRPVATPLRITDAPIIDGALDEHMWQETMALTGFIQADPLEGLPASEETEVRILYDDNAIFVGVTCHDRDPSQIVTIEGRRDSGLNEMDSFQMIFDTYRDRQNGFVFGTNSVGIEFDGQVSNEGDINASWDGSWEVKTQINDTSWTAEFRIPLRTLRYGPPPQVWGINFMRNFQRNREKSYWSPLARIYDLGRLSSAGELRGLELKAPRNFKAFPYVITSANRNFTPGARTDVNPDWGVDAKFGVTTSLNLDVTYNTDFAQVEVDTQQINLTRFNLRFPEKRPFFLENSGLFTVGKGSDLDLFFSRRIGLDDQGNLVPIKAGARLSGKARGFNVGMLTCRPIIAAMWTEGRGTILRPCARAGNCRAGPALARSLLIGPRPAAWPGSTTGTALWAWTASSVSAKR